MVKINYNKTELSQKYITISILPWTILLVGSGIWYKHHQGFIKDHFPSTITVKYK